MDDEPPAKRARTESPAPPNTKNYWLFKSEPDTRLEKGTDVSFSIDDLMRCTEPEPWTGVRAHGPKNSMKAMKVGDKGLFYHSNTKTPGVVGILEVVQEATPDPSAFDKTGPYYDRLSTHENPRWHCVSVGFVQKFDKPELTTLRELKKHTSGALEGMQLLRQSRLSVSSVTAKQWDAILGLA
ncbi:DUF55-domain-containing protein, partial [Microthyrium microscopicum]